MSKVYSTNVLNFHTSQRISSQINSWFNTESVVPHCNNYICSKCSTLQCSNFTATSRYYSKHIHDITSESKCRNLRETVEMSQSDVLLQCCVVCGEMKESLWLAGDGGAPAPECEGAQSSSVFTELWWGKQVLQQHTSVVIISDKVWHQLMMNN